MQKNLLDFFNKSDKHVLPSKWLSDPLPKTPKKRCVGRPRKEASSSPRPIQTAVEFSTGRPQMTSSTTVTSASPVAEQDDKTNGEPNSSAGTIILVSEQPETAVPVADQNSLVAAVTSVSITSDVADSPANDGDASATSVPLDDQPTSGNGT